MMKKLQLIGFALMAIMFLASCSNESESLVRNLESCLGDVKTKEDLNKLDKSEAVELAKCMLPYLEEADLKDMSSEEKKELRKIMESSEYKGALGAMNPNAIKRLAKE